MTKIYRLLLRLYPQKHRAEVGQEMTAVFRDAQSALRPALATKISFYQREYFGLLFGAVHAHLNRLLGPGIPFRRHDMKPQFRFPRATVGLLLANFAGAIFIIAKGNAISHVIGIWPVFGSVVVHLLIFVLLAISAAVLLWAVLNNLHRTGAHRLENVRIGTNSSGSC
jgi:hypothetical protein